MKLRSMKSICLFLLLSFISQFSRAQQSLFYQRGKDVCLQAASKTKCAEKAAYYRKMADWNQCMLDQLAGKKVSCVEVSGIVPACAEDEVGGVKNGSTGNSNNSASKTNPVMEAAKTQEKVSAIGTLVDKNASQTEKNNAMDRLSGNPVGATNTFMSIASIIAGDQKKEKITNDLLVSYKKIKYLFSNKYSLDYDEYISSIIDGDYTKWKSLYKSEIDINTILIHNLPNSFEYLYLGNVAFVSAYYGNSNFLQKLLDEFPNVALNFDGKAYNYSEPLEVAILAGRTDIVKILLINGAIVHYKNVTKKETYEGKAKLLGNFEIAQLLKEYRENKKREVREPIDAKFIGWDDDNVQYLLRKNRSSDRYQTWSWKKVTIEKKTSETMQTPEKSIQNSSIADEIKKLKDLFDAGTITKEEFDAAKKKVLERN